MPPDRKHPSSEASRTDTGRDVQEVEIAGVAFVLLPKSDFRRLEEEARQGREDASKFGRAVGPDLRARRRRAKLTLADIAGAAGIRLETLSRIENGRENPTIRTVQAVLLALDRLSGAGDGRARVPEDPGGPEGSGNASKPC